MQLSPFSENHLRCCIRSGDSAKFNVDLDADRERLLSETQSKIKTSTLVFDQREVILSKGRKLFLVENYHGALALRATARSLNRQFGVHAGNRDAIVRAVIETLFDATPSYLLRCDIQSFFENVDAESILQEIQNSTRTHPHIKEVLRRLREESLLGGATKGVPRGIGLSTTLAELALRELDRKVRQIPGVYRYFRFADDILVFSIGKVEPVKAEIEKILKPSLSLNNKTETVTLDSLPDTEKRPCTQAASTFSYLGYRFECQNGMRARQSRRLQVCISDNKVAVRKTRVILSLKAFTKDKNASLLIDRIRYLTSNFEITKSGHSHGSSKAKVKTGIFYNYHQCGEYEHGKFGPRLTSTDLDELKKLDGFLSALLWGSGSEFRTSIKAALTPQQILDLKKLSFLQGFQKKMTVRFTRSTVSQIRKAWQYA